MAPLRPQATFCLVALTLGALVACKRGEETTPDAAVLPTPSASATSSSAPPVVPTGAATATAPTGPGVPAGPKADAGAPQDAGAGDAGKTDAGAAADGGAGADAGASSAAKAQACFQKCQQVMQGCLSAGIGLSDGGVPQLKDPTGCQKAADACKAGCQ